MTKPEITKQATDLTKLFQHTRLSTAVGNASKLPATLQAVGKMLVTHSLQGLPTLRMYSEAFVRRMLLTTKHG